LSDLISISEIELPWRTVCTVVTDYSFNELDRVYRGATTFLNMEYDIIKGGISTKSDVGNFIYNNSFKPYADSLIYPSTGITPGAAQTITYTSFESINSITEAAFNATFTYNSDDERAKMVVNQNGNAILTRWYPTSSYIKETSGSDTKEYTFIGGDVYTAPVVAIKQNGGAPVYYYLLRDHLGSITHVVNASTAHWQYRS
jgi:hypothetical protein